ncbi:MAG: hypothetical protein AB7R77_12635 [Ilumatobacteraceae bacterium]
MSLEANEVVIGLTGHLYRAPIGTALPANISTALPAHVWVELGYTTPDGVTFSFGRDVNKIMGWQSFEALRVVTTALPKTIKASLLQMNQNTFSSAMGGGYWTEPTSGKYQYDPADEDDVDEFVYIVEFTDKGYTYRFIFRRVQNTSGAEFTVNRNDAVALPLEVEVLGSNTPGEKPWLLQTDDPNLGLLASAGS